MSANIPATDKKRIVIVGGGFGGLQLMEHLRSSNYQVVLIDQNNYHQFPPLLYQIATAGLNPSSISFPFRRLFARRKNQFFRLATLRAVFPEEKYIQTSIGKISYDYLVLCAGSTTNFFGNEDIAAAAMPMKTVAEAAGLRNALLSNFERALTCSDERERQELLNVVVVGGGPSGVEIAGAIAEMRRYVLPRDYPDMDASRMHIYLVEGSPKLLGAMSAKASDSARKFLQQLNVELLLNVMVSDYRDNTVYLSDGRSIPSLTFIWVGGVRAQSVPGLGEDCLGRGGRLKVNKYHQVAGYSDIYAIGDIALMSGDPDYPAGHPMMAQPAIQQGVNLAYNFCAQEKNQNLRPFCYRDLGSMATIGRNLAVADIGRAHFAGFFAWFLWMAVHLRSILGIHNKLAVLLDWVWSYITYDRSNRMIMRAKLPLVLQERARREQSTHWGKLAKEQEAFLKEQVSTPEKH